MAFSPCLSCGEHFLAIAVPVYHISRLRGHLQNLQWGRFGFANLRYLNITLEQWGVWTGDWLHPAHPEVCTHGSVNAGTCHNVTHILDILASHLSIAMHAFMYRHSAGMGQTPPCSKAHLRAQQVGINGAA